MPGVITKHPEPILISLPSATCNPSLILSSVMIKHPEPIILVLPSATGTLILILPGVIMKHPEPIILILPNATCTLLRPITNAPEPIISHICDTGSAHAGMFHRFL